MPDEWNRDAGWRTWKSRKGRLRLFRGWTQLRGVSAWPRGAAKVLHVLRDYFAPDDRGIAHQDVGRLLQLKRIARTTDEHLAQFELLRLQAESRAQKGRSFPESSVSISRMQNAPPPRANVSLILASAHGSLGFASVASQVRRQCGPMGDSAHEGVSAVTEKGEKTESPSDVDDSEAREEYRMAEKSLATGEKW